MVKQNFEMVQLQHEVDRQLAPSQQNSERYVMLTLTVPSPQRPLGRLPLNLSLVIDRSGSMSGDKLSYVKEAAIHALRTLTETDRASVVIYDDEVDLLGPSQTMTPSAKNDLIERIRNVRPGGMTHLSGGWFTGCDQIADHMSDNSLNRALLLTDGLANVGLTDHEELVHKAKGLRRRGISTTTFGVGSDFNQFLLQGMADAGGGHFYFIDSPNQIPNYFTGELGEMLNTVVREITLEIDLPEGVTADLLNVTPHERLSDRLRLFLGDAYAGEQRTLILRLTLPPRTPGYDFGLSMTLRYEDVRQQQALTVEPAAVHFIVASVQACEAQPVNEQVLREAGRMTTEKAKMEALAQEYRGDIKGATSTLRQTGNLVNQMLSPAEAKVYLAELAEMEHQTQTGMSEKMRKAKHYATYQIQRSRKDYKK